MVLCEREERPGGHAHTIAAGEWRNQIATACYCHWSLYNLYTVTVQLEFAPLFGYTQITQSQDPNGSMWKELKRLMDGLYGKFFLRERNCASAYHYLSRGSEKQRIDIGFQVFNLSNYPLQLSYSYWMKWLLISHVGCHATRYYVVYIYFPPARWGPLDFIRDTSFSFFSLLPPTANCRTSIAPDRSAHCRTTTASYRSRSFIFYLFSLSFLFLFSLFSLSFLSLFSLFSLSFLSFFSLFSLSFLSLFSLSLSHSLFSLSFLSILSFFSLK